MWSVEVQHYAHYIEGCVPESLAVRRKAGPIFRVGPTMVLCKVLIVLMEGEYPRIQNVKHQDALVTSRARGSDHTTVITLQFCCDYSCSWTSQPQKVHQIGWVDQVEDTSVLMSCTLDLSCATPSPCTVQMINLLAISLLCIYTMELSCVTECYASNGQELDRAESRAGQG
jgi:hypothetical protein